MKRFDTDPRGRKVGRKEYRKVVSNYPSQFYFADLVDWNKKENVTNDAWKNSNNDYSYILVVVDAFSRYCWMVNIKDKSNAEVGRAFEEVFSSNVYNIAGNAEEVDLPEKVQTIPKCLVTDAGKEFCSKKMDEYFMYNNIKHIVLQGDSKAMIAERVIQDYRMYIRNRWDGIVWYKWTDDFVDFYNHKYHSVIRETPHNVFVEGMLPYNAKPVNKKVKDTLQINDQVRLRAEKNALRKRSLTNNWTTDIYTIVEIDRRMYPYMYKVKDSNGKIVARKYYAWELQAVQEQPD